MKFHKVMKNAENLYQTLWSDDHETRWFMCSSSHQFAGEPYEVDEAMVFPSSEKGEICSWSELAVRKPHSVDHGVHEQLVQEAYDTLMEKEGREYAEDAAADGRERMRSEATEKRDSDFSDVDWVG